MNKRTLNEGKLCYKYLPKGIYLSSSKFPNDTLNYNFTGFKGYCRKFLAIIPSFFKTNYELIIILRYFRNTFSQYTPALAFVIKYFAGFLKKQKIGPFIVKHSIRIDATFSIICPHWK